MTIMDREEWLRRTRQAPVIAAKPLDRKTRIQVRIVVTGAVIGFVFCAWQLFTPGYMGHDPKYLLGTLLFMPAFVLGLLGRRNNFWVWHITELAGFLGYGLWFSSFMQWLGW